MDVLVMEDCFIKLSGTRDAWYYGDEYWKLKMIWIFNDSIIKSVSLSMKTECVPDSYYHSNL